MMQYLKLLNAEFEIRNTLGFTLEMSSQHLENFHSRRLFAIARAVEWKVLSCFDLVISGHMGRLAVD